MLPKINRLRKNKEIERVFKNGRSYREGFLFLKLLKNDLTISRFSFVVGQKVSKKANVRNRIKRRMRAVTRKELLKIRSSFDVVLVATKGLESKDRQETEKTVKQLLQKSGICR